MKFAPAFALLCATSAFGQVWNEPPLAVDIDPSPSVVEVNLTAAPTTWEYINGVQTPVWAYNGTVPGPTIRAKLGDRIKVNFTNNLPDETTVHWHGIESPAIVDGSHIAQLIVPPGGTYTYEWTAINEGMHWYHPHVRPFDQVEQGLYGAIIITDLLYEESLGFLGAFEEHVVIFDDILLDSNNQVVPAFSFTDPLQNAIYQLNGREGNLLLVNGKDSSTAGLTVPNGQPQRWRVLNAANTTLCRLDLGSPEFGGINETVFQIGSDQGIINKPWPRQWVTSTFPTPPDNTVGGGDPSGVEPDHPGQALIFEMEQGIFLMPGERMDVVFTPIGNDGETFMVNQADWFRGRHTASYGTAGNIVLGEDPLDGAYPNQRFMTLTTQGPDPGTGQYVLPATLRSFNELGAWIPQGKHTFTYGHGLPAPNGDVTFFAQAEMVSGMMSPLPAMKIDSFKAFDAPVGAVWDWDIVNLTHGEHNFHSHGFKFQLLEYEFQDMVTPTNNYVAPPLFKRQWQDTVRVPPRLGAKGTSKTITRLRVQFDDTGRTTNGGVVAQGMTPTFAPDGTFTSGGWLAHCHLLEHSGRGMLTVFEIHDPADPFTLLGKELDGTSGKLSLTATGDPSLPGTNLTFTGVNGVPDKRGFILVGNCAANRTIAGGTVVPGLSNDGCQTIKPSPLYRWRFINFDANGRADFVTPLPADLPSGTTLYVQMIVNDPGAPQSWQISNALSFVLP